MQVAAVQGESQQKMEKRKIPITTIQKNGGD
jgi:hypothetical protein